MNFVLLEDGETRQVEQMIFKVLSDASFLSVGLIVPSEEICVS